MFDGMNKKAAAVAASERGEDRISDLPDALLHHALSLLPVHQAVQTSVLARRWRHLWKGMPALRLVDPKTRFATVQDIDRFVNRLIANRGHLPLVSFEVDAHAYLTWDDYGGDFEDPEPNLYFHLWIQYALACKVQVLKVAGKLVGSGLQLSVPLISQHLRNLYLHDVYIGNYMEIDSMDFSSCPVLEELKMEEGGIWVRSISFPSLKRLFLIKCIFPGDQRASISAPGLVSLRLVQCAGKTPLLESMTLLETASIDLSRRHYGFMDKCEGCTDVSCEGCHGYPVGSYRSVLLNVLSNAINLELKDQPEVYIYKRDLECCPIFGRLKTLLLDMWCRHVDMHALVCFLQHTPILGKLILQLRSDKNHLCAGQGESKHVRIEQSFSCAHLKEVSIECEENLRVKDKVRQIVKILTRNGILKEQITFKKLPRPKGLHRVVAVSSSSSDDSW